MEIMEFKNEVTVDQCSPGTPGVAELTIFHFDPPGWIIQNGEEYARFDTGEMGGWEFFSKAIFRALDGDVEFLRSHLTERRSDGRP